MSPRRHDHSVVGIAGRAAACRLTENDIGWTGRLRLVFTGCWWELLPVWQSVVLMRNLATIICRERRPRGFEAAQRFKRILTMMEGSAITSLAQAAELARSQTTAESWAASNAQLDEQTIFRVNLERGKDLLMAFWSQPEDTLSRLRHCQECRRFFLDRSPA